MGDFWNPYLPPASTRRRAIGIGSVASVLILWSLLAVTGLVSPARLPAPWDVVRALGYLSWHDGESMLFTATLWSVGRLVAAGLLVILPVTSMIAMPFLRSLRVQVLAQVIG